MIATHDSFSSMLKRLYTAEVVKDAFCGPHDDTSEVGYVVELEDGPRNVIRNIQAEYDAAQQATAIGTAAVMVVTSVAALEWLRRRKADVAAAEHDEAAFEGLLAEFVAWLRGWLERLRFMQKETP